MRKTIIAGLVALASFGAYADYADDGLAYRIDQDSVTYVDANMLWADNCEFQLNARVARVGVTTDGKIADDDDWGEILGTLCDQNMGFSTMF